MKPDLYTKAVLAVIAIILTVMASNQYFNRRITVQAQTFAGITFSMDQGRPTIFDSRSGEIWGYFANGQVETKLRLQRLGQPLGK